jgi:hypothetical protein
VSEIQRQHDVGVVDESGVRQTGTLLYKIRHWSEGGFSRRECQILLRFNNLEIEGQGTDLFNAFCCVREKLAEMKLKPLCYGASRNVYPSGMLRDTGAATAYRLRGGVSPNVEDIVGIFNEGPDMDLVSVTEQRLFWEDWLRHATQ